MTEAETGAAGARQMLVLLRGLVRDQRHWGEFAELLRTRCAGWLVYTPDLAGNGQRYQQPSPATISAMVDDLRQQLGLTASDRLHLVCLSLGGMVGALWASRFPDEVASLVMINSSIRPYAPFWQRLRPRSCGALLACGWRAPAAREQAILHLTSNHHQQDRPLLQQWQQWANACPVSPANALRQLWAAARFYQPSPPPVPLLLLSSRGDQLVHWRCSNALAEAWHQPLYVHPDAGHDLPLDAPDWVVERLTGWWRGQGMV